MNRLKDKRQWKKYVKLIGGGGGGVDQKNLVIMLKLHAFSIESLTLKFSVRRYELEKYLRQSFLADNQSTTNCVSKSG